MTPEAQRIVIAEACGWEYRPNPKVIHPNKLRFWIAPWMRDFEGSGAPDSEPPDYLNDLNAMHEAESILTPENWTVYMPILHEIVGRAVNLCIHATAAQRAEAFLRAIGKWTNE